MKANASKPKRTGQAFTLVEMLVTLGICGILAALLIAGTSKAKNAASGAKCMGNLKQLGVAVQLYVQDNDGSLPGLGPTNPTVFMTLGWLPTLNMYMNMPPTAFPDVYRCPAAREDPDVLPVWKKSITSYNSYGINRSFLLKKVGTIGRPSQKALIADVSNPYLSSIESFFDNSVWGVSKRHVNQSANVLWLDGHVSSMPTSLLKDPQYILPD